MIIRRSVCRAVQRATRSTVRPRYQAQSLVHFSLPNALLGPQKFFQRSLANAASSTPSTGSAHPQLPEELEVPQTGQNAEEVYHGPISDTFRRLKIFSLSSLTLSFVMTPFLFVIETTSALPLVARFALAGVALTTSGVSTALVAWCGRPYVTTLRRLDGTSEHGGSIGAKATNGVEMTTLTLALHQRITRVYDTAFLVPTSRPFAVWELAEVFHLSGATKDNIPIGEETVAETMDKDGKILGRWIVQWAAGGVGTCRQVGHVCRYFNVHEELLNIPVR